MAIAEAKKEPKPAAFITVYSFDPITMEYRGPTKAQLSPKDWEIGNREQDGSALYLYPANSTKKKPALNSGKDYRWTPESKEWIEIPRVYPDTTISTSKAIHLPTLQVEFVPRPVVIENCAADVEGEKKVKVMGLRSTEENIAKVNKAVQEHDYNTGKVIELRCRRNKILTDLDQVRNQMVREEYLVSVGSMTAESKKYTDSQRKEFEEHCKILADCMTTAKESPKTFEFPTKPSFLA
jgi:hypothetical protein